MEGSNSRKDEEVTYEEEEVCSYPKKVNAVCSNNRTERNPMQEKFGAHPGLMPDDDTKDSDHDEELDENQPDEDSNRTDILQRHVMDYRMVMERKRRQSFKEKVEVLQRMMPMPPKPDIAGKLENVIDYIKSLHYQIDIMYWAQAAGYMSPYYGAHQPRKSPWGYYPPGIPMMPQQAKPYIPQNDQGDNNMAPPDQTKPQQDTPDDDNPQNDQENNNMAEPDQTKP